jgi:hypothetical protein
MTAVVFFAMLALSAQSESQESTAVLAADAASSSEAASSDDPVAIPDPAPPPSATPQPMTPPATVIPSAPVLPQDRLLVLDVVDKGAGDEIATAVSGAVQGQATKSFAGETVIPDQITASLDASAQQVLLGCDAEGCMTNIGRRIEATRVLATSVAKVGDDVLITVLVVDPRDARRIAYEQRKVAPYKDLYFYAARQLVALALTGRSVDPTVPVRVTLEPVVSDATVLVDGRDIGAPPLTLQLDPGTHVIEVKASGYATWRSSVTVEDAMPQDIGVTLTSERITLWPVALTLGVASSLFLAGGLIAGIVSQDMYNGSIPLGPIDPWTVENSYVHASPVSSADLAAREQAVRSTALLADGLYVVGGVVVVLAAIVLTVDLVTMAVAE